jgi:hypothetical protein
MRLMGFLFLSLTFLAGVTVGTVQIGLINIVVFLGLALLADYFLAPRYGKNGLVFGMAGAFFLSFLWPVVVHAWRGHAICMGEYCPGKEREVTVTLSPPR